MAMCGDGATSEGDFHEALNFAAVFNAPVVFFVQNNEYAISVPLARQSVAPSLAHKGVGYGVPGERVDGNDMAALLAVLGARSRRRGPARGRSWSRRTPTGCRRTPTPTTPPATARTTRSRPGSRGTRSPGWRRTCAPPARSTDEQLAEFTAEADRLAAHTRDGLNLDVTPDHEDLFAHVYAEPTPQLREQAAVVADELSREGDAR